LNIKTHLLLWVDEKNKNMQEEKGINEISNSDNQSVEQPDSFEVPKEDWIEKAIEYEALPKSLREPQKKGDFIKSLGIPESTYRWTLSKDENQDKIIKLSFRQARKRTPDVLKKLGEKAEQGNDTSITQFMEYVLEIKKRLDITSGGEKIRQIYGGISKCSSNEEDIQPQEEN
jgi:hypothetical protein